MATRRYPCRTCDGTRVLTVSVPEVKTGTVYDRWPCDGGRPRKVTYHTGRMVARSFRCETCNGLGMVVEPQPARVHVGAP